MPSPTRSRWDRGPWLALAGLLVFAVAVLPPALWLVNAPTLVAGIPLLYLWSLLWGVLGTGLLYAITQHGYFGIAPDQVPPELRGGGSPVQGERSAATRPTLGSED